MRIMMKGRRMRMMMMKRRKRMNTLSYFQILGRLGFNVQITIKSTIDHSTVEKAPRLGIRIVFLIFPSDTIW